jgi:uncharacterized protein YbjT (DUF2867 family)
MAKDIIAVVGATGAQGGGLVRAALADPHGRFAVRALTRKPEEAKAEALRKLGAEVVGADLDEAASLAKAFAGARCAYCVTNFWEHFSPERELAQAKNMAQAARSAGLRHVIWSTLEDTRLLVPLSDDRMPTLKEHYKVPHFDAKGSADVFFRQAEVPTTFLLTSFYWENLIHFGMGPQKGEDGRLAFVLPMAERKLPGIGVEDIGKCAYGIFKRGEDMVGRTVGVAGEHLTGEAMAASLAAALGREIEYRYVPPEIYRTFGFPGADDLGNMFQYNRDFAEAFCAARDPAFARSVNPELLSFDQWLELNKSRIPMD